MSASTPNIGLGTLVEISPPGTPTWATLGFVTGVNGPQESAPLVEVTNMQSTAKEYIYGVPDGGELTVESNYAADHATHDSETGVLYFLRNQIKPQIRLTPPGATVANSRETYQVIVQKSDRTFPVDGVQKLSVSFKITGAIAVG